MNDAAPIRVAGNSHHATVQHLNEAQTNLDISDGNDDTTPIRAVGNGHHAVARQLVTEQADLDGKAPT